MPRLVLHHVELKDDEAFAYFVKCCRIRDLHPASMVRRIVRLAAEQQLIEAILDDGAAKRDRKTGEHGFDTWTGRHAADAQTA